MAQPPSLELQTKQKQSLKQMQRLIMSPQMQQAITILQMPVLELSEKVEAEITENPILENSEEENNQSLDEPNISHDEESESPDLAPEKELHFDDQNFEILKRIDQEFRDYFNESNSGYNKPTNEEEQLKNFIESSLCKQTTLFEHLMMQAREIFSEEDERTMAEAIIGNFDHSGFFAESISEVAALNNFDEKKLLAVLQAIQQFEPHGVGAKNLQESLLLQLKSRNKEDSLAYKILSEHYRELLHNDIPRIQKALKCTRKAIAKAIECDIAKLEMHPGADFDQSIAFPIIPDATLYFEGDKLQVLVNEDRLPQLRFNRRYMRMLDDPTLPLETRDFIKQKILSAQWLLQNIHQRNSTIERIAASLAQRQRSFFNGPEGQLTPLTMKTLAEELNLHESTIARAVANKYLHSPRGLFPLRFFFTNGYITSDGEDLSSKTVREKLLALIKDENKQKPLSDEALSLLLQAQGIACARRTVAKYRTALNLGNAHQRKKFDL